MEVRAYRDDIRVRTQSLELKVDLENRTILGGYLCKFQLLNPEATELRLQLPSSEKFKVVSVTLDDSPAEWTTDTEDEIGDCDFALGYHYDLLHFDYAACKAFERSTNRGNGSVVLPSNFPPTDPAEVQARALKAQRTLVIVFEWINPTIADSSLFFSDLSSSSCPIASTIGRGSSTNTATANGSSIHKMLDSFVKSIAPIKKNSNVNSSSSSMTSPSSISTTNNTTSNNNNNISPSPSDSNDETSVLPPFYDVSLCTAQFHSPSACWFPCVSWVYTLRGEWSVKVLSNSSHVVIAPGACQQSAVGASHSLWSFYSAALQPHQVCLFSSSLFQKRSGNSNCRSPIQVSRAAINNAEIAFAQQKNKENNNNSTLSQNENDDNPLSSNNNNNNTKQFNNLNADDTAPIPPPLSVNYFTLKGYEHLLEPTTISFADSLLSIEDFVRSPLPFSEVKILFLPSFFNAHNSEPPSFSIGSDSQDVFTTLGPQAAAASLACLTTSMNKSSICVFGSLIVLDIDLLHIDGDIPKAYEARRVLSDAIGSIWTDTVFSIPTGMPAFKTAWVSTGLSTFLGEVGRTIALGLNESKFDIVRRLDAVIRMVELGNDDTPLASPNLKCHSVGAALRDPTLLLKAPVAFNYLSRISGPDATEEAIFILCNKAVNNSPAKVFLNPVDMLLALATQNALVGSAGPEFAVLAAQRAQRGDFLKELPPAFEDFRSSWLVSTGCPELRMAFTWSIKHNRMDVLVSQRVPEPPPSLLPGHIAHALTSAHLRLAAADRQLDSQMLANPQLMEMSLADDINDFADNNNNNVNSQGVSSSANPAPRMRTSPVLPLQRDSTAAHILLMRTLASSVPISLMQRLPLLDSSDIGGDVVPLEWVHDPVDMVLADGAIGYGMLPRDGSIMTGSSTTAALHLESDPIRKEEQSAVAELQRLENTFKVHQRGRFQKRYRGPLRVTVVCEDSTLEQTIELAPLEKSLGSSASRSLSQCHPVPGLGAAAGTISVPKILRRSRLATEDDEGHKDDANVNSANAATGTGNSNNDRLDDLNSGATTKRFAGDYSDLDKLLDPYRHAKQYWGRCPILWVRLDSERSWPGRVLRHQSASMWAQQLLNDPDIAAQVEALKAISVLVPNLSSKRSHTAYVAISDASSHQGALSRADWIAVGAAASLPLSEVLRRPEFFCGIRGGAARALAFLARRGVQLAAEELSDALERRWLIGGRGGVALPIRLLAPGVTELRTVVESAKAIAHAVDVSQFDDVLNSRLLALLVALLDASDFNGWAFCEEAFMAKVLLAVAELDLPIETINIRTEAGVEPSTFLILIRKLSHSILRLLRVDLASQSTNHAVSCAALRVLAMQPIIHELAVEEFDFSFLDFIAVSCPLHPLSASTTANSTSNNGHGDHSLLSTDPYLVLPSFFWDSALNLAGQAPSHQNLQQILMELAQPQPGSARKRRKSSAKPSSQSLPLKEGPAGTVCACRLANARYKARKMGTVAHHRISGFGGLQVSKAALFGFLKYTMEGVIRPALPLPEGYSMSNILGAASATARLPKKPTTLKGSQGVSSGEGINNLLGKEIRSGENSAGTNSGRVQKHASLQGTGAGNSSSLRPVGLVNRTSWEVYQTVEEKQAAVETGSGVLYAAIWMSWWSNIMLQHIKAEVSQSANSNASQNANVKQKSSAVAAAASLDGGDEKKKCDSAANSASVAREVFDAKDVLSAAPWLLVAGWDAFADAVSTVSMQSPSVLLPLLRPGQVRAKVHGNCLRVLGIPVFLKIAQHGHEGVLKAFPRISFSEALTVLINKLCREWNVRTETLWGLPHPNMTEMITVSDDKVQQLLQNPTQTILSGCGAEPERPGVPIPVPAAYLPAVIPWPSDVSQKEINAVASLPSGFVICTILWNVLRSFQKVRGLRDPLLISAKNVYKAFFGVSVPAVAAEAAACSGIRPTISVPDGSLIERAWKASISNESSPSTVPAEALDVKLGYLSSSEHLRKSRKLQLALSNVLNIASSINVLACAAMPPGAREPQPNQGTSSISSWLARSLLGGKLCDVGELDNILRVSLASNLHRLKDFGGQTLADAYSADIVKYVAAVHK